MSEAGLSGSGRAASRSRCRPGHLLRIVRRSRSLGLAGRSVASGIRRRPPGRPPSGCGRAARLQPLSVLPQDEVGARLPRDSAARSIRLRSAAESAGSAFPARLGGSCSGHDIVLRHEGIKCNDKVITRLSGRVGGGNSGSSARPDLACTLLRGYFSSFSSCVQVVVSEASSKHSAIQREPAPWLPHAAELTRRPRSRSRSRSTDARRRPLTVVRGQEFFAPRGRRDQPARAAALRKFRKGGVKYLTLLPAGIAQGCRLAGRARLAPSTGVLERRVALPAIRLPVRPRRNPAPSDFRAARCPP